MWVYEVITGVYGNQVSARNDSLIIHAHCRSSRNERNKPVPNVCFYPVSSAALNCRMLVTISFRTYVYWTFWHELNPETRLCAVDIVLRDTLYHRGTRGACMRITTAVCYCYNPWLARILHAAWRHSDVCIRVQRKLLLLFRSHLCHYSVGGAFSFGIFSFYESLSTLCGWLAQRQGCRVEGLPPYDVSAYQIFCWGCLP
jgi:hypothetical protein